MLLIKACIKFYVYYNFMFLLKYAYKNHTHYIYNSYTDTRKNVDTHQTIKSSCL